MKKNNPFTPILIREAQGVEPKVWARYGEFSPSLIVLATGLTKILEYGREQMAPLIGLDDKAIEGKVTELVKTTK